MTDFIVQDIRCDGGGSESDTDRDPLRHAAIGTTVVHRESKTLHSINYTPSTYFGSDRIPGDIDIVDVELVETDDDSCGPDIRITWEGEITKKLPRNWDSHPEPVTETERRHARRQRWLGRIGRVAGVVLPMAVAGWVTLMVMDMLAGSMTINGEPVTAPAPGEFAAVFGTITVIGLLIMWGLRSGLPGMANAGGARCR